MFCGPAEVVNWLTNLRHANAIMGVVLVPRSRRLGSSQPPVASPFGSNPVADADDDGPDRADERTVSEWLSGNLPGPHSSSALADDALNTP